MRVNAKKLSILLREALPNLSWRHNVNVRRETYAGMVGALLVIPQAITFSYLAGVAPVYGLYCAIFVGLLASLFGTSPMVTGPNTAVSILLGLSVLPFAGRGSPLFVEFILLLSIMAGLIQLLIWLLRGAALFRYFSPPAIAGIKAGVGVLLITAALEGSLGLSPMTTNFFYEKFYVAIMSSRDLVNPYAFAIAVVTIATGLSLRRRWPSSYIFGAVLAGSVTGGLLYGWYGPMQTDLELLGHMPLEALPFSTPTLGPQHWLFMEQVVPQAFAIAVLGLAQSLVITNDLKSRIEGDLDLHKETFAQGLANTVSPFFSAFAGSGSFNRTSVNLEMRAVTPLSGMIAAVGVALIAWILGPVLAWMPMAVISGILALVGIGMIQGNDAKMLRNPVDCPVLLFTVFSVVFLGLQTGIFVAMIMSVVFFVASVSRVKLTVHADENGHERVDVKGNLFFASVDRLAAHLGRNPQGHTVLDITCVSYCDSTAEELINRIRTERERRGGRLEVNTVA